MARAMMTTILLSIVATTMLLEVALAENHAVGGSAGSWDTLTDLKSWASSETFTVGDNLVFSYTTNHDVVEVSKDDYDSCTASNGISNTVSPTTIKLTDAGSRYFICGTPGHCDQGMRVEIKTVAATSGPPTATTPPSSGTPPNKPVNEPAKPSSASTVKMTAVSMDFRSVWAVAGFAVAVVFTWRSLRTPNGSRRRQPSSPSTSGFTSHSNESLLPSEDLGEQQCAKPTLGQIVRKRLSDGRKVTCRLLGVILEENTPEELQNQATVKSSVLDVLLEITKHSDLYLMERVLDDESQNKVLMALENAGVLTSGGMVKDKVLFCSTENGRTSFVRQLEPDWHIDSNPEITSQLSRFIRHQLHISTKTEQIGSNVHIASSLEEFFTA